MEIFDLYEQQQWISAMEKLTARISQIYKQNIKINSQNITNLQAEHYKINSQNITNLQAEH